jgi:hypothetical protein
MHDATYQISLQISKKYLHRIFDHPVPLLGLLGLALGISPGESTRNILEEGNISCKAFQLFTYTAWVNRENRATRRLPGTEPTDNVWSASSTRLM